MQRTYLSEHMRSNPGLVSARTDLNSLPAITGTHWEDRRALGQKGLWEDVVRMEVRRGSGHELFHQNIIVRELIETDKRRALAFTYQQKDAIAHVGPLTEDGIQVTTEYPAAGHAYCVWRAAYTGDAQLDTETASLVLQTVDAVKALGSNGLVKNVAISPAYENVV